MPPTGPVLIETCRSTRQNPATGAYLCVGCDEKNSAGSGRAACGLHTPIGRKSRRRKGLDASRTKDKEVKSFRAVAQINNFSALTEPSGYNALSYFRT